MRTVPIHLRPQRLHIRSRRRWRRPSHSHRSETAAGLEDRKTARGDVAADGIEYRVNALHDFGEVLRAVVDHLVGAELAHIVMVRRARGGNNAGAEVLCERDGEAAHPARAALDQDRLAALQFQRVLEGHQRGEPGQRHRCALHVAQLLRLAGDDRLADGDLFGVRAFARHLADAEHRIAGLEVARALDHDAGEVAPRHMRKFHLRPVMPAAHLPVGGVDARRVDLDEHFAGCGNGVGQLAVLEDFGAAVAAKEGGLHKPCYLNSSLRSTAKLERSISPCGPWNSQRFDLR